MQSKFDGIQILVKLTSIPVTTVDIKSSKGSYSLDIHYISYVMLDIRVFSCHRIQIRSFSSKISMAFGLCICLAQIYLKGLDRQSIYKIAIKFLINERLISFAPHHRSSSIFASFLDFLLEIVSHLMNMPLIRLAKFDVY